MNANLDKIAQELYGKIQTRFSDIKIGDESAEVLSKKEDIPNARFFEFEYEEDGESLGTIAITLDADDGIVLQVSGDLVDDNDSTTRHGSYKFIRSFRQFAKDRLLNFDIQNIGKSNLDKRDYTFQAKRKEEPVMAQQPVMENKMYGNARMSYQDLGEARLVVKHTQPINLELAAGRTQHIDAIYIENAQGERFRYPYKHLNGARALAEHIKHGGNPYDAIGKHICSLSEELASLRKFKGYVSRQEQVSEAMGSVTDRVLERIDVIKETIHKLQRPAYYESFVESFEEQEEQMIPEEIQNDLIDRLTIRTFNEELKAVFPYIYKFVDESELAVLEVNADDLLDEAGNSAQQAAIAIAKKKEKKVAESPEDQYESFMNSIVSEDKDEVFSPNRDISRSAIDQLNQLMSAEIKGGPEGINAIESLKGLIDDPEFVNSLRDIDPDLDVRPLVQQFLQQRDPDVAAQLEIGDDSIGGADVAAEPAPEMPVAAAPEEVPAEPMAAAAAPEMPVAPAPEMPVAEAKDTVEKDADGNIKSWKHEGDWKKSSDKKDPRGKVTNASGQALKKTIAMAKKAGATLETQMDFGDKVMTIAEVLESCGMQPQDVGFDQESGLPAMLKYISGFYNKDNGNFPLGGMRVKIKVKKAFEDGEFGTAQPEDLMKVLKFIDMKDPSDDVHGQEQSHVLKLAGVGHSHEVARDESYSSMPSFDVATLETQLASVQESTGYDEFQRLISLVHFR